MILNLFKSNEIYIGVWNMKGKDATKAKERKSSQKDVWSPNYICISFGEFALFFVIIESDIFSWFNCLICENAIGENAKNVAIYLHYLFLVFKIVSVKLTINL